MGNKQNKSNTGHTHDDRYFTEREITTKLSSKANDEEGTWTPQSPALSGIESYDATYAKVGNIVYCNFTIEAYRRKEVKMFVMQGLPFPVRNSMVVGTMWCLTASSPSDSRVGFTNQAGTKNVQIVDVYKYDSTSIKGVFKEDKSTCYLPSYNKISDVTIEGAFIYRTT